MINPHFFDQIRDEFITSSLEPKWAWTNKGSSSATVSGGSLTITAIGSPVFLLEACDRIGTKWEIVAKISIAYGQTSGGYGGIMVYNSVNTRNTCIQIPSNAAVSSGIAVVQKRIGTGFNSNPTSFAMPGFTGYLKATCDGVLYSLRTSTDGVSYTSRFSETLATFLQGPITHVGFLSTGTGSGTQVVIDWIRRTA